MSGSVLFNSLVLRGVFFVIVVLSSFFLFTIVFIWIGDLFMIPSCLIVYFLSVSWKSGGGVLNIRFTSTYNYIWNLNKGLIIIAKPSKTIIKQFPFKSLKNHIIFSVFTWPVQTYLAEMVCKISILLKIYYKILRTAFGLWKIQPRININKLQNVYSVMSLEVFLKRHVLLKTWYCLGYKLWNTLWQT